MLAGTGVIGHHDCTSFILLKAQIFSADVDGIVERARKISYPLTRFGINQCAAIERTGYCSNRHAGQARNVGRLHSGAGF